MVNDSVISVKNIKTYFYSEKRCNRAVNGVSFEVRRGRTLCIVGESGCGKSVTASSIMQLLPRLSRIEEGEIIYHSEDRGDIVLSDLPRNGKEMRSIRGKDIAMIFQDPMTALNPVFKVGWQISENILFHENVSKKEAHARALALMNQMGIPEPEKRINQYPHEYSGGMRQRAMIAMAMSCNPKVLLADEPTTALDVTIQAQILDLMKSLQEELGMAIITITHDLGVVAQMCDEVIVMYAGSICEQGTADEIFYNPCHEYTKGLLRSIPTEGNDGEKLEPITGTPIDLLNMPKGCPFAPRCDNAMKICLRERAERMQINDDHAAGCWMNVKKQMEGGEKA